MAKDIKCTCGHSWNKSDSSKKDMYVCHMCGNSNVAKAQVGYKLGKSEDEVRQAVLKKAAEVFAGKKKPYKLPENIEQIEGSGANVCISGVCGILSDAGFIPNDYYTNTSFAEKASELGFGSPQTDINILKPGDVFQHLVDTNEQGNHYPTHAEIFKGWNDKGEAEFYDYYDFYNWPISKSSGIRTYNRSELEQRLSRKAKNDQSDTQAQFFSLAGGQNKATKQFPYNLPENELKDYFEKTHEANTTFSAPAPTIDKNSPLYYSSGEDVRQGTREGLADMFNDKELDKQLKRELKITDQDLQKIKPLIYGVVGQESQFNNPRSTEGGLKYMFENMFSPKGKSLGPGQIKLKSITPSVRESFGIKKGSDLQDLKNTYIGLADIISKSANITDKYVSQETHPDLVDKDRFERALYFLNSPGKVRKSDKQNYDKSMQSNSILTNFSEQAMMDAVDKANKTKLSMDPGSYPAKVLDRAKELNKAINFEDTSVLPEVVVTAKKKKKDGGWLSKFDQGGMVLEQKTDNYGKKPNPNNVQVSTGPGYVGLGYDVQGRDYSPAWGGQFKDGGNIMPAMAGANQTVPMYQMGGVLPGAVGFTYARTVGAAPSNGKYAKKTKASAQDGKVVQEKRHSNLYSPIESKIDAAIKSYDEYYNLPGSTQRFIDRYVKASPSVYDVRNIPPVDPVISEVQQKIQGLSNKEVNKLLHTDWSKMGIVGAMKNTPSNVSYPEMLKYISHFNKLKKKGYTFQNGGDMKFYQEGLDFKPKTISQDGSEIPVDPMGYWNPENIGNPVIIPSTDITMEGVDQPLIGISDTGDVQYMEPGEDYEFEGEYVTEYPVAKKGISVNNADAQPIKKLDQLLNFTNYNKPTKGGWLSKYQYGGGVLSRSNLETMAALEKDIKNQKARNAQETVSQYTSKPRDQQRMNAAKDAYRAEEAKPLNRAASSRVAAKAMENIVEPMLAIETGMGAGKLVKPALETAGKYLTEKTALKNAYKINPYAFKPNKTAAYRMIGDERGYIDAVESGFLKPGKGSDIGKMHTETHFQMGVPSDKREYFGRTWSRGYDGPYMAEVLNAANDARFSSGPGGKLMGNNVWTYPENYIPTSQAKIYKQDWLKGYKEIAKKEDGGWLNKYK